jgi:nucleoside-diphosphate kinase
MLFWVKFLQWLLCFLFLQQSIGPINAFLRSSSNLKLFGQVRRGSATSLLAERTFVLLKPDTIERKLVGEILQRIERKGFKLLGMKLLRPSTEIVEKHYAEHKGKSFYQGLVDFFLSGPILAMVWEGDKAVELMRLLVGKTHPEDAQPGTIRGDYCYQRGMNLVHSSDSVESAQREINIWFRPEELIE